MRCLKVGSILRNSKGRIVSLEVDPSQTIVGCHGVDNTIELFHFLQDSKVKEKVTKRLKKERKKANGFVYKN